MWNNYNTNNGRRNNTEIKEKYEGNLSNELKVKEERKEKELDI